MIVELALSLLFRVSPAPVTLTVDLDGDGSAETVTAISRGRKIRIGVTDAAGKSVARAEAPAPGAGASAIALTAGSIGDSGALLEVSATAAEGRCRTVWRLRGRELAIVPLIGPKGRLPDCSSAEGWTESWKKPREDAPSEYVRERARPTANGDHHRTQVYRFVGFELRFDSELSTAEIGAVAIPNWSSAALYPKPLMETLSSSFNLSAFRTAPHLSFVTDRDEGVFAVVVERPTGSQRLAVSACRPGKERGQWSLTAGPQTNPVNLEVKIGSDRHSPLEVTTDAWGEPFGRVYVPATRLTSAGLELFATVEDEVALASLAGSWDNNRGERIVVTCLSLTPAILDFGKKRVTPSIVRAPRGADLLLLPEDGSPPEIALMLRGPNVMAQMPVSCSAEAAPGPETCHVSGHGQIFHRVGAEMNVR